MGTRLASAGVTQTKDQDASIAVGTVYVLNARNVLGKPVIALSAQLA